ncbi:hypothetical protein D3C86_1851740 [compost metagenome]
MRLERLPDHPVGGELLVADHHLIARAPIQAERHEGQRLRGAFDQRDIVARGGIEQSRQAFAQATFDQQPIRVVAGANPGVLFGKAFDRQHGAPWPGRDCGVVQVTQAGKLRKLVMNAVHGRMIRAILR